MTRFPGLKLSAGALWLTATLFLAPSSAQAGVITSGCVSGTSCTLAELYLGGTITINDVVFDNWVETLNDGGPLVPSDVVVSGIDETPDVPTKSLLGLSFVADPALAFDFLEYDFDFDVSFSPSGRTLTRADLDLITYAVGGGFDFVEVNADLLPGIGLLSVDHTGATDSLALAGLTALTADFDIQMEVDSDFVSLTRFDFMLQVMESSANRVPEPATLLLLSIGLFTLFWRYSASTNKV